MLKHELIIKTVIAAVVKALAAFIAFFMTVAVTRGVGAEQAGLFLLAISFIAFSSVLLRLGLDNVVLRLISADGGGRTSIGAMSTGLIACFMCALLISLAIFLNVDFISDKVFSKPEFSGVLSIMIWVLPLAVVFMLLSFGFQAYFRVFASICFQGLGVSSLFLLFVGCLFYVADKELSILNLSISYLIAGLIIFILSLVLWHKQINGKWGRIRFNDANLWGSAVNLWMASSMGLAVQWSGVLLAGALVSSADVAYLSAAQRTAMLASFVLMVVNMVVAPRYARLWQDGKKTEIKRLAKWSTRGMIVMAVPIVAAMIFFPEVIMELFGDEFKTSGNLLAIMATGQFINVATGSVGYLLSMSGHEKDLRRVTFFSGPLTVLLSYVLILQYGVLGAAIATAVGLSVQNLLALIVVRKRLGFWPIG